MIFLLGDLKGVKNLIIKNKTSELENKLTFIATTFTQLYSKYRSKNKSIYGYIFSDSVMCKWLNDNEGRKYAPKFALEFWRKTNENNLSYRIFVDGGNSICDKDSLSEAWEKEDDHFVKIFPVNIAVWSVFVAEASHLSDGVYLGNMFKQNYKGAEYIVGNRFYYIKIC